MPTITLKITHEQLEELLAGQTDLAATLRYKKPKASAGLTPDEKDKQERVIDLWLSHRPTDNAGRVWKALRAVPLDTDNLVQALETALDWTGGRHYSPEWFAKDHAAWLDRMRLNGWTAESERSRYRNER